MLKRFVQANGIQPSCYYSSNSSVRGKKKKNLPVSAVAPTPAASRLCTEVQSADVQHRIWQRGLYEQSGEHVVAGLRPKHDTKQRRPKLSERDLQTNCQIIKHHWACQANVAWFQPGCPTTLQLHLNTEPGVQTEFSYEKSVIELDQSARQIS